MSNDKKSTSGAANAKIKTDPVRLAENKDAAAGN